MGQPFLIYGRVYNETTSSYVPNQDIDITYESHPQETVTTDTNGFFQVVIMNQASDGEDITLSFTRGGVYTYKTYTLDITDLSKEINLIITTTLEEYTDLIIEWGDNPADHITCACSGWSRENDEIKVTVYLDENQKDLLMDNLVPGAVENLYSVLGENYYTDTTWQDNNTLKLTPSGGCNLPNMYRETTIIVKSISTEPLSPTKWCVILLGYNIYEVM